MRKIKKNHKKQFRKYKIIQKITDVTYILILIK